MRADGGRFGAGSPELVHFCCEKVTPTSQRPGQPAWTGPKGAPWPDGPDEELDELPAVAALASSLAGVSVDPAAPFSLPPDWPASDDESSDDVEARSLVAESFVGAGLETA